MIAVDTNVLVRYIVQDDEKQSAEAEALFNRALDRDEPLFFSQIVLCELRRGAHVTIEGSDEVKRAIDAYAAGRGDFADYLIAERAFGHGCSVVATFDQVLHTDSRFRRPDRVD